MAADRSFMKVFTNINNNIGKPKQHVGSLSWKICSIILMQR